MTNKTSPLMPHVVLSDSKNGGPVGLSFTENEFAGIVFKYKDVKFKELLEEDRLQIKFEYEILEVPFSKKDFDKPTFEKVLGDFMVQLLYYGLERDHLGFIDDENRNDNSV